MLQYVCLCLILQLISGSAKTEVKQMQMTTSKEKNSPVVGAQLGQKYHLALVRDCLLGTTFNPLY